MASGDAAPAAGAAAHVFVGRLDQPELELDEADAHHLTRALRLRPGEAVTASDGCGRWRLCRITAATVARSVLEAEGAVHFEPRGVPVLTVGFVPVKGSRPEWTVQKLTELGVDRIVPLLAARSVVRWEGERADRQVERWRRIAREAAGQSRRVWLPDLTDLSDFDAAATLPGAALAEFGGDAPDLAHPTVLIGPEGGWTAGERSAGLARVGLGPTVLRAETAALAAASLLAALRAGTVRPHVR